MYMKLLQNHAYNHLPFSDSPYDKYALRSGRQRGKNRHLSYVVARDATGIGRMQDRTTGGGSSRRGATFLYTSLLCGLNIHILNYGRSLKTFGGVWYGVPRNCGEPRRFEPWSTLYMTRSPTLKVTFSFRHFCAFSSCLKRAVTR